MACGRPDAVAQVRPFELFDVLALLTIPPVCAQGCRYWLRQWMWHLWQSMVVASPGMMGRVQAMPRSVAQALWLG